LLKPRISLSGDDMLNNDRQVLLSDNLRQGALS